MSPSGSLWRFDLYPGIDSGLEHSKLDFSNFAAFPLCGSVLFLRSVPHETQQSMNNVQFYLSDVREQTKQTDRDKNQNSGWCLPNGEMWIKVPLAERGMKEALRLLEVHGVVVTQLYSHVKIHWTMSFKAVPFTISMIYLHLKCNADSWAPPPDILMTLTQLEGHSGELLCASFLPECAPCFVPSVIPKGILKPTMSKRENIQL